MHVSAYVRNRLTGGRRASSLRECQVIGEAGHGVGLRGAQPAVMGEARDRELVEGDQRLQLAGGEPRGDRLQLAARAGEDVVDRRARRRALVDAEVVGDDLRVQESQDQQRNSDRTDECECGQNEARSYGWRGVPWAISRPPRRCEHRERSGGHLAQNGNGRFVQVYGEFVREV
jgi:hypothetical protein